MRMRTGLFCVMLSIGLVGCGKQAANKPAPTEPDTAWDGTRLVAYLKDVPGIRKLEPWDGPYGKGITIETDHYRIQTTLSDPLMLRQVPAFVESAYQAYESQLPDRITPAEKFVTYLFADRSGWEDFTKTFAGADAEVYLKIQRGAFASNGVCVAYNIGRKQTFSILGHEGWHQYTQRQFKYRLPSWLDEGIATLFETCRYNQGQFEFRPQENLMRLGALKQAISGGRLLRIADLITLNPGEVLDGHDSENSGALSFYGQTYALVRFLREYDYGRRLGNYHTLLLEGMRGQWPVEAALAEAAGNRDIPLTVAWNRRISPQLFTIYFGKDIDTIERQYRRFCDEMVYHIRLAQNQPMEK